MCEAILEAVNVHYVYPDGTIALNGVTMKIFRGERVAILGPNGAGKSTLLMIFDGLFTPTKGHIKVFGKELSKKVKYEMRRKVGLVFQDADDQLFSPTLWDDVTFGPLHLRLSENEITERAERILSLLGLEELKRKPPYRLSEGEKKKAALATVLVMEPEVLLLDEPTTNLDPKSREEFINFLNELHRTQGTTLISATHDVNAVPRLANRVYVMDKVVIGEGTVKEIFSNTKLLKAANLSAPEIAKIFMMLKKCELPCLTDDLPLTAEEAAELLVKMCKNRDATQ